MKELTQALRAGGRTSAWLVPVLVATAWLGCTFAAPRLPDGDGSAAGPWLHVPWFLLVAAVCVAVIEAWPAFSRARAGAGWLLRWRAGPLRGCGLCSLGALLVLLPGLLAIAVVPAVLPEAMPAPRAHRDLGQGQLGGLRPGSAPFRLAGPAFPCHELHLRPLVILPAQGPAEAALVEVRVDGAAVGPPLVLAGAQLLRVPLHDRLVHSLELVHAGGTVSAVFPPGSVVAVGSHEHGRLANALLAGAAYALPAGLLLGLATFAAPFLSLPVALATALGVLLLATLGGALPTSAVADAMLRGRWLPAEWPRLWPAVGRALLVTAGLFGAALLAHRGRQA